MKLHVETAGAGPDVVLLHGWGMNGSVWSDLVELLAPRLRLHIIDLPGHGASAACGAETLDVLARHVAQEAPRQCGVCGWSLGGQVALAWARLAPQQVTRVALMAATPCFAQREDWPHAVRAEILRDFARSLAADCEATLKRFLALQAFGDARAGQVARRLREALFARGRPDASALQRSLAMLLGVDLRRQLAAVAQPALVIHGERDGLSPPSAGAHLSRMLPNARLVMMRGAAHAPFLSSAGEVGALLADFFHGG